MFSEYQNSWNSETKLQNKHSRYTWSSKCPQQLKSHMNTPENKALMDEINVTHISHKFSSKTLWKTLPDTKL